MADLTSGLTINNASGAVYRTSRVALNDGNIKAKELSNLLQKLISVGIYESLEEAILAEVPAGTFVVIDDPNTDIREFTVEMVPSYVIELKEDLKEREELLKRQAAENAAKIQEDLVSE
jgi:hypothetical protein